MKKELSTLDSNLAPPPWSNRSFLLTFEELINRARIKLEFYSTHQYQFEQQ